MKVKICGLSRPEDIAAVNTARPDYCGFIVHVPKSRRNVSADTLRALRADLADGIIPVGVFVNEPVESVADLLESGVLSIAQLHGQEDDAYIAALRARASRPIWQAFQVKSAADIERANRSLADFILLDAGAGGGTAFDWTLLDGVTRPFALAGGLNEHNLSAALQTRATLLDLSSGVETDGYKDFHKIQTVVQTIKGE